MKRILIVSFLSLFFSAGVFAEVKIEEPWVRATVGTQSTSGAFMRLTSSQDARLVEVRSPVAGLVEIHEMALENNVMRMRAVDGIELPAGQAAELRPGGFHVMLMDLKGPLNAGEQVRLTLTVEGADGKREDIDVLAPVRPLVPGKAMGKPMHGH